MGVQLNIYKGLIQDPFIDEDGNELDEEADFDNERIDSTHFGRALPYYIKGLKDEFGSNEGDPFTSLTLHERIDVAGFDVVYLGPDTLAQLKLDYAAHPVMADRDLQEYHHDMVTLFELVDGPCGAQIG